MKKQLLFLFAFFLCLGFLSPPLNLRAAVTNMRPNQTSDLRGWWKFDENSGYYAYDSSGNGNTSNYMQGLSGWTTGHFGYAVNYTALNYSISFPSSATLNPGTSNFSISMWGYYRDFTYPKAWFMSDKTASYACSAGSAGFEIGHAYLPSGINICVSDSATSSGNASIAFDNGYQPSQLLNTWVNLIVVFDRTAGRVKFYVNGVKQSNELDISAITGSLSSTGSLNFAALHGWRTDGIIDDYRVYSKALSNDEALGIYASGLKANVSENDRVTSGLLGLWSFNGQDMYGTTIYDRSGNGLNATNSGGTAAVGPVGQALSFDGSSNYVALPSLSTNFSSTGITLCSWAYFTNNTNWQRIFDLGNGAANNNILFARSGTSADLAYQVYSGGSGGGTILATGAIVQNTWMHLCATETTGGAVILYKNGVAVASGSTYVPVAVTRSSNFMARSNWGGDGYYGGMFDEARIYSRVLSPTEIAQIYNQRTVKVNAPQNTKVATGLSGYYTFNGPDVSGSTALDVSGYGRSGTMSSTSIVPGRIGQALFFRRDIDSRVQLPYSSTMGFNSSFTVSAWIKTSVDSSGDHTVVGTDRAGTNMGLALIIRNNKPFMGFYNNDTSGNTTINAGDWYHVVYRYNVSGGEQAIYVNGALDASSTGHAAYAGNDPVLIGQWYHNDGVTFRNFEGTIDDVRIYNRVLSTSEINQLYLLGK